jgi:hypothetical protein
MLELLFIPFAIAFIAVQLSDRRVLRISFAILTLIALAAGGIMLRVAHSYGRSYIALAVDDLAKKAPPDQRERLIAATKEFRREFQEESAFSIAASSRLWSAIKQVNYSKSKEAEGDRGQPAPRPESK